MKTEKERNIAYIVNMPYGFDPWSFREIEALTEDGLNISIFPLKYGDGPYLPRDDWDCYRFNKWLVVLRQPLWFLKQPGNYSSLLLEAITTGSLVDFLLGFDFAQQMARKKIQMIHCVFGAHQLFIGYYCKRILGIPLSVALYGYDLRANPNWTMFQKAIKETDAIIVNCEFNRGLLADRAGNELAGRAKVIRHYAQTLADDHPHKTSILIVGRFEERKGHDLLFRAVKALGPEGANVEVWVAGFPGPVDVPQLVHDLGVEDKVRIFGNISDEGLALLFQRCDIFCLPSRTESDGVSEGLPVALIEAMAHGKPVISTRLAGIPELVEEILVEEEDLQGLTQAVRRLVGDPKLRSSLGARNLEIVKARYSKRNVLQTRDLFLETLES